MTSTTTRPPPPGHPSATVSASPGRLRRGRLLVVAGLVALLALVALASLAVGAKPIPIGQVWDAIWSPTGTENDIVVRSLRAPRTVLGIGVGIALGLAGALMQGHTRNPLADPGIPRGGGGRGLFHGGRYYMFGVTSVFDYVWFAFAGAFAASVLVFVLGSLGRGGLTPVTLALAGVAVSFLLYSLIQALLLADPATLDAYRFWVTGSPAGRGTEVAAQIAPFLLVGLLLAVLNAPGLNLLALGEDVVRALGQRVAVTRWTGLAAITLLSGAAVAADAQARTDPVSDTPLVIPVGRRNRQPTNSEVPHLIVRRSPDRQPPEPAPRPPSDTRSR
jgi:iron complex transport system permease protein